MDNFIITLEDLANIKAVDDGRGGKYYVQSLADHQAMLHRQSLRRNEDTGVFAIVARSQQQAKDEAVTGLVE